MRGVALELDLETFLTTLYVMTDDLYVTTLLPQMPVTGGPTPKLSDSEVLCLGLAAQWRVGVPWQSERGFVRFALKHLRACFPQMTSQSAFNRRLRRLWGAFILLQQAVVQALAAQHVCEIIDCVPLRLARGDPLLSTHGWPRARAAARVARMVSSMVSAACSPLHPAVSSWVGCWLLATCRTAGWPSCCSVRVRAHRPWSDPASPRAPASRRHRPTEWAPGKRRDPPLPAPLPRISVSMAITGSRTGVTPTECRS